MVRECAGVLLKLIRNNEGLVPEEVLNPDEDVQKLIDIILGECRCSIMDKDGNYARFGSSTDIRVIRILIQLFLSNAKKIPPEVVSMALTKEGVIGPFRNIEIAKRYDEKSGTYKLEMEDIFPNEFHVDIFKENTEVREKFIKQIIKPYVKEIIYGNDDLMRKSPIGSYINKHIIRLFVTEKTDDELVNELKEALKVGSDTNEGLIDNIANYIFINIMCNKFFKEELINRSLETTELQKLGKISIGFGGLVDSMAYETLQMIELRSFPYGEIISIKNTFNTVAAVLDALSMDFENIGEDEILERIEQINRNYTNKSEVKYRTQVANSNKYGDSTEFVNVKDIENSMKNLCKMIKVLLDKKDEIDSDVYLKEVLRIHYRFIKIQPFESGNGRTARAIVNVLLMSKGMIGIFRKEKRKEYIEYINEANKIIKENEAKYLAALGEKTMECVELENGFLDKEIALPFLLVKS